MSTNAIQDAVSALGLGNTTQTSQTSNSQMGQEQFMQLMLAQLKNQDPMQPMQNGEFLAEIAQFNTASGIQGLQGSFSGLVDSLQSNQALQASTLVGRSVLVQSQVGVLPDQGSLSGIANLPSSTNQLSLDVYDASGQLVHHAALGAHASGDVSFSWDGTGDNGQQLPTGPYTVAVTANIDGQPQTLDTYVADRVDSVTLGQGGSSPTLNLANLGNMDFSKVSKIM